MTIQELVRLNFERLLELSGMSQKDVAARYPGKHGDVAPNYISQLFSAEKLTLRAIKNLAQVFRVEETELVRTVIEVPPGIAVLLDKVHEILTSEDTDAAEALTKNIIQFFKSVERDRQLSRALNYCSHLEERIELLEQKIKSIPADADPEPESSAGGGT